MKPAKDTSSFSKDSKFILALHSSTDELGVGLIHLGNNKESIRSSIFPLGNNLSNQLFKSIETLLPSKFWSQIVRVAVATGPGGYTGTRITIVFARTIGQQLNCQVDGISSFELMVPRLISSLNDYEIKKSFWITKLLKRHGLIGGKYKIINNNKSDNELKAEELISPLLISSDYNLDKQLLATDDVSKDIVRLLEISLSFHKERKKSSWDEILPIYPTSPVQAKQ